MTRISLMATLLVGMAASAYAQDGTLLKSTRIMSRLTVPIIQAHSSSIEFTEIDGEAGKDFVPPAANWVAFLVDMDPSAAQALTTRMSVMVEFWNAATQQWRNMTGALIVGEPSKTPTDLRFVLRRDQVVGLDAVSTKWRVLIDNKSTVLVGVVVEYWDTY